MMNPKLLYRAFSFSEFLGVLLLRLICAFALVYSLLHFKENPVVILIFGSICLLFIFILGEDQISVYTDKIVHSTNSIASWVFRSKGKVYRINELKHAYLKPEEKLPNAFEMGVILLLMAFLPRGNRSNHTRPIFFDTKTGDSLQVDTHLSHSQMQKVVETVNSLIKKNSH